MDHTVIFCSNPTCPFRGQSGKGNIRLHSCKDKRFLSAILIAP